MPIRTATYALARPVPYLLEREAAQTIQAPIRHGADGALVAPDSVAPILSTVSVIRPGGTALVDEQAISVTSSVASYDLTAALLDDAEPLGEGWDVRWTLIFGGVTYPTFRQSAYLCEYVPPNVISVLDLYDRRPELKYRVPQGQGERGDDVGWQPQIDAAYYLLLQRLIDDGRRPWLIREVTGYREWLLVRALQLCVEAISDGPDTRWAQASKDLAFSMRTAEAGFKVQYSDVASTRRSGGAGLIRLAPVGRPAW